MTTEITFTETVTETITPISWQELNFELGLALGRMQEKLDRIEKQLDRLATPEQIAFEGRVARSGFCHCRDCEERRAKPFTCSECGVQLPFTRIFFYKGNPVCSEHLPEYCKESEGW